jgi:hypothetical protein
MMSVGCAWCAMARCAPTWTTQDEPEDEVRVREEVGNALEHRPGLEDKRRERNLVTMEGQVSDPRGCVHGRAWSLARLLPLLLLARTRGS